MTRKTRKRLVRFLLIPIIILLLLISVAVIILNTQQQRIVGYALNELNKKIPGKVVIGGSDIYAQAIDVADRIYLTQVHAEIDADTFFLELDRDSWVEKESSYQPIDDRNQYAITFGLLERKTG